LTRLNETGWIEFIPVEGSLSDHFAEEAKNSYGRPPLLASSDPYRAMVNSAHGRHHNVMKIQAELGFLQYFRDFHRDRHRMLAGLNFPLKGPSGEPICLNVTDEITSAVFNRILPFDEVSAAMKRFAVLVGRDTKTTKIMKRQLPEDYPQPRWETIEGAGS